MVDPLRGSVAEVRRAIIERIVRRRLAALRQPRRALRIARALWICWALIIWNVVFDHVIVVAGRRYIGAATAAANGPGQYARMDDWMRPAVARAFWTASGAALTVLVIGLILTSAASDRLPARASRTL